MKDNESLKVAILGELADRLIPFRECMERIHFPKSIWTFRRRVQSVIEEFGGPAPIEPDHFTYAQFQIFLRRLEELEKLRRTKRKGRLSQDETTKASND